MLEVLQTCSLAIYLVALLYGAYRIFKSRRTHRAAVHEHYRKFILFSRRARAAHTAPHLSYYV